MHIGIDLGTTYSLIARMDAKNTPVLFPDLRDANQFRTASIAAITLDGALVGQAVEDMLDENPALEVIQHVKLRMGDPKPVFRDPRGKDWLPECVSALILKKLLRDANAYSDETIRRAVIAIPANFSEHQRRATLSAARLAGLQQTSLIEEPVAAGMYYGAKHHDAEKNILVYDLGGGTFDVTVLRTSPQGLDVLATDGSPQLGGKDIDEAIMKQIAAAFVAQTGFDPFQDRAAAHQLRRHAESMKIKLSQPAKTKVETMLLLGGRTVDFVMTRAQFDKLIAPIIAQSIEVCQHLLERTRMEWNHLDEVIMVGGSTLLPTVPTALRSVLPDPATNIRQHLPHMAIAFGAALSAANDAGELKDVPSLRHGASRYGLGFRTRDPRTNSLGVDLLIPPNTPTPIKKSTSYRMNRPDQTRLILEVVQVPVTGEMQISLGHLAFRFNRPPVAQPINVTLAYDAQGLISVSAHNTQTGERAEQQFLENGGQLDRPTPEQQALLDQTPLIH